MKIKIGALDPKFKLIKNLSAVYDKSKKNLVVLDRLHKAAKKLKDKELEDHLEEAIKHYSKSVDFLFDAKVRIWELD